MDIMNFFNLKMKLLYRNAQPRFLFLLCMIFNFLTVMYIDTLSNSGRVIEILGELNFIHIGLLTMSIGCFSSFFGRLSDSLDNSYIDLIMCMESKEKYISGNYYFLTFLTFISYLLTSLFLIFIDSSLLWISFSIFIFHVGVTNLFFLSISILSPIKIEINKREVFSFYGKDVNSSLYSLIFFVPPLVFAVMKFISLTHLVPFLFGIVGLLSLMFHKRILKKIEHRYNENICDFRKEIVNS